MWALFSILGKKQKLAVVMCRARVPGATGCLGALGTVYAALIRARVVVEDGAVSVGQADGLRIPHIHIEHHDQGCWVSVRWCTHHPTRGSMFQGNLIQCAGECVSTRGKKTNKFNNLLVQCIPF